MSCRTRRTDSCRCGWTSPTRWSWTAIRACCVQPSATWFATPSSSAAREASSTFVGGRMAMPWSWRWRTPAAGCPTARPPKLFEPVRAAWHRPVRTRVGAGDRAPGGRSARRHRGSRKPARARLRLHGTSADCALTRRSDGVGAPRPWGAPTHQVSLARSQSRASLAGRHYDGVRGGPGADCRIRCLDGRPW